MWKVLSQGIRVQYESPITSENIQKIAISLALEFVGGTLHENHENWYPTKIKPSTVGWWKSVGDEMSKAGHSWHTLSQIAQSGTTGNVSGLCSAQQWKVGSQESHTRWFGLHHVPKIIHIYQLWPWPLTLQMKIVHLPFVLNKCQLWLRWT